MVEDMAPIFPYAYLKVISDICFSFTLKLKMNQ